MVASVWRRRSRVLGVALSCGAVIACSAPESAGPRTLSQRLELATRDDDVAVRAAATRALVQRGKWSSLDVVAERLRDPVERIRRDVLGTFSYDQPAEHERQRLLELLVAATHDESSMIRTAALQYIAVLDSDGTTTRDAVRRCTDDTNPVVEMLALDVMLDWPDHGDQDERIVRVFDARPDPRFDPYLAPLLSGLSKPNEACLARMQRSGRAEARYAAECARERLNDVDGEWSAAVRVEATFHHENRAAQGALRLATWRAIPREQLTARVRDSRFVVCGETHAESGPLRDNQIELLRAFIRDPEHEAIGYEPTAWNAQQGIVELADSLGVRALPLEVHWESLGPERRYGARDLEVARIADEFLDADPRNRLFVVRGESHVLPHGFLDTRLKHEPIVVLAEEHPPLELTGLRANGMTFSVGDTGRVFAMPYDDEFWLYDVAVLEPWLARH